MNYRKLTGGTLLFCSLILLGLIPRALVSSPSSPAAAAAVAPADGVKPAKAAALDALANLKGQAKGELTAHVSRETGHYNFVSAADGPLVADDTSATPQKRALSFLAAHGALVGMNDAERAALGRGGVPAAGSDLQIARTHSDSIGMTHVKMNQFYQGLPVFGAQVVVHMNEKGITAVNGKYVPDVSLSTIPSMSQGRAMETAITIARKHGAGREARPGKVELSVYALGLLEGHPIRNVLAYAVEVSSPALHEQIWLNAETGAVLNRIPLRHSALNRIVYSPQYDPENPDDFVIHREGDPVPPPSLVTPPPSNLYHFAGHTYNFFASAFGRDSYDDKGITMRSVYLINEICPNAYWNGQSTNYCPEVDGDDVVAHEWGHAYTQYTHDLIYSYQSGALNESYSDVWGETVDLHNGFDGEGGSNNAQPRPEGQRWQIGEDTQGINQPALGILRNMWDPTEYGNPDKVSSPLYHCDASDGGGVHTNSGPPNHTFAMLVDGKTFNGQTVDGIGFTKAVHIYFRAMTVYQTRTTNFAEHEQALKQSCQDLKGKPLSGFNAGAVPVAGATITQADCQQLAKATLATELSKPVACNFAPLLKPEAPDICDGASEIFSEDWETGDNGWTRTSEGVFEDWEDQSRPIRDFKIRASLPGDRAGSAAFAPNPAIGEPGGGNCVPGQQDYSGQFTIDSPQITIPDGANGVHLKFDHYVATEVEYDGGQVEISKDNGATYELVPQNQYRYNPPNQPFGEPAPVGNNTNPNAGEFSWNGTNTGEQGGSWGTTVLDLSDMVAPGDKVKIRFTYSQDGCNGVHGWYVDNIRLYNCPVLRAPKLSIGGGYENPDTNGRYTLKWNRPPAATGPDTVQESTTSCSPLIYDDAEGDTSQWNVSSTGSYAGFNWESSTEKPMHESAAFRARAAESTTNASAILTFKDPITIPRGGTTKLTFQDWIMNESDDGGMVEVSENGTNWKAVYTNTRSDLAPFAAELFATEPLFQQEVDLTSYRGKTIRVRFRYFVGPDNKAGSSPLGWYVDNIAVINDNWHNVGTTNDTSLTVSGRPTGSYCYRVRTTYTFGSVKAQSPASNIVNVQVAPGVSKPAHLQNLSARARVRPDDNVLIGGFIIQDAPKRVIVRALGPSLQSDGSAVPGRLSDPVLDLYRSGNPDPIGSNDDWQTNQAAIQKTGAAPTHPREAAIVRTLQPGTYTAVMRGKNREIGIGLLEIYDLDSGARTTLKNLSARAFIETDNNVLIGGFLAGPATDGPTKIVVRAIGPSLKARIPAALDDTTLEVVDANGARITNDDWGQSPDSAAIAKMGLAPKHPKESALLLRSLPPGPHTAIVRGKGQPRGVGLVEIYDVQ